MDGALTRAGPAPPSPTPRLGRAAGVRARHRLHKQSRGPAWAGTGLGRVPPRRSFEERTNPMRPRASPRRRAEEPGAGLGPLEGWGGPRQRALRAAPAAAAQHGWLRPRSSI